MCHIYDAQGSKGLGSSKKYPMSRYRRYYKVLSRDVLKNLQKTNSAISHKVIQPVYDLYNNYNFPICIHKLSRIFNLFIRVKQLRVITYFLK